MKKVFSMWVVILISVALFAQQPRVAGGGGNGVVFTGGTISDGTSLVVNGIASGTITTATYRGDNCATSAGWVACGGGPPYENRKDDGKGPTLVQVKSAAKKLTAEQLPPAEYITIAKSVGLDGPIIEQAKILDLIDDIGLHVYDFRRVDDYLYRQALRQGTNVRWVWKPIRKRDNEAISNQLLVGRDGVGMVYPKTYAQPLPVSALKLMKQIECEMADVVFLVSDYEVVKPDPFLAITTKSLLDAGKIWIVYQWDEPNFNDGVPSLVAKR